MYNDLPHTESFAASRGVAPQHFCRRAAFWWGYNQPRVALHTSVLFCLLFYLLPLHVPIARVAPHLPFLRGKVAGIYDNTGFNLPFLIVMVLLWGLMYLLIWALMEILIIRADVEPEAAMVASAINYSNGLSGLQRTLVGATVGLATVFAFIGIGGLTYSILSAAIIAGVTFGTLRPTLDEKKAVLKSEEIKQQIKQTEEALAGQEGVVQKTYVWHFDEHPEADGSSQIRFEITVPVGGARYEEFRAMSHDVHQESDYARFVLKGITPEIALVGDHLRRIAVEREYSSFQNACNALAFSRQFHYAYDLDTTGQVEYPRYPIEMLWDEVGDCECHAILAAALLKCMGFDIVLFFMHFSDRSVSHIAVGVAGAEDMPADDNYYVDPATGVRYFYCEATPPSDRATDEPCYINWRVGQVPFDNVSRIAPISLRGEIMDNSGSG